MLCCDRILKLSLRPPAGAVLCGVVEKLDGDDVADLLRYVVPSVLCGVVVSWCALKVSINPTSTN